MNIFENLIKDTEIIGVGKLNSTESTPGSATTTIVQYTFKVFTRLSTIMIYSPEFRITNPDNMNDWLKQAMIIREKIAVQIGELEPQ